MILDCVVTAKAEKTQLISQTAPMMSVKVLSILLIVCASLLCTGQKIWPSRQRPLKPGESDVGVEEWFGAGSVELLQPEQVHLSYWGNPNEMWVTWVSCESFGHRE